MNNSTNDQKKAFDHTLIDDKYFFGGYLNLAENNIEIVFKSFAEKFEASKETVNYSDIIYRQFRHLNSLPEFQTKIAYLRQFFPVVDYLYDPQSPDITLFCNNLVLLLKSLHDLRSFYTHYYHRPIEFKKPPYDLLDEIFYQVIRRVSQKKMKADKTRETLKATLRDELQILKDQKKTELDNFTKDGKKIKSSEVEIENAVLNDAFFHLKFKDKVSKTYSSKFEEVAENKINISQSGLLFLLGMFLTKRESEELRSKVKGFKAKVVVDTEKPIDKKNNSLKFMATHWVFGYLAYKGAKKRLVTEFHKETLLLQIVDELSKVPDELYSVLSKQNKDAFIEDINEFIKQGKADLTLEESTVVHPVIRKRYENKFAYFVLRFLDEFVDFPTLRFQIHLGNFIQNEKLKIIEGTNFQTNRVIKKKIKVFGRLSQVSEMKTNYLLMRTQIEEQYWDIFPNPSYNFVSENIPIFINLHESDHPRAKELFKILVKKKNSKSDSAGKHDKISKETIANLIFATAKKSKENGISISAPTAFLSLNELAGMLYQLLVKGVAGSEIEHLLIDKMLERVDTISNFKLSDKLPTSQIAKKLVKSSANSKIDLIKLSRALENELIITEKKIETIKNKRDLNLKSKPQRKQLFSFTEIGREATWLANELKRFMPVEARMKWRGHHHSQLQSSLAFFNNNTNEPLSILKQFWNFADEKYLWNEKIKEILDKSNSFDSLLCEFLEFRKSFFDDLSKQFKGFEANKKLASQFVTQQNLWTLFHKRLFTIDETAAIIDKLLSKPLVFPRGIFDEKPTYIKGKDIRDNPELFADWYRYTTEPHKLQSFYNFERDYSSLFEKSENSLLEDSNSNNEKKIIRNWERKIKEVKNQDLFLKLICEHILKATFHHSQAIDLTQFYKSKDERYEIAEKVKQQSLREVGDKSANLLKENYLLSLSVPFNYRNVSDPAVKLKDVGKFNYFLKDQKVNRIFEYQPERKWTKLELENELLIGKGSYEEIRRDHILKTIHDFEKAILKSYNLSDNEHPEELQIGANPNFKMYVANGFLRRLNLADVGEIDWLIAGDAAESAETYLKLQEESKYVQKAFLLIYIRNKYAHNQLPTKELFEVIKKNVLNEGKNCEKFSAVINEFVLQTVNEFKQYIK